MKKKPPICCHTSAGLAEAHYNFEKKLEQVLPFNTTDHPDWKIDLQVEGASAVLAAIDGVLGLKPPKKNGRYMVAASSTSYHGPGGTSPGNTDSLRGRKFEQVFFPSPFVQSSLEKAEQMLSIWLHENHASVDAILVEPQSGSSAACQCWNPSLLREFVVAAQSMGIRAIGDEVMCGVGRHGQGEKIFVSDAWQIPFDAYVIGKGIGGGAFPLAATIFRSDPGVMAHRHTFAGACHLSMDVASKTLQEIPNWFVNINIIENMFRKHLVGQAERLGFCVSGQGCLWGVYLPNKKIQNQISHECTQMGLLVYCANNAMLLTPPFDMDPKKVRVGIDILLKAMEKTRLASGLSFENF